MAPKFTLAAALALPAMAMAAALPSTSNINVVGGDKAELGEVPFIVSLSDSQGHFCGGALLDAETVLTAAHCSVDTNAADVKVRAGTLTWASGGKQVGVDSITIHPKYQDNTQNNDVAIWKLSSSIAKSSTIGYATLPSNGSDPAAKNLVIIAGWGDTKENSGSGSKNLLKTTVPVVSRSECQAKYEPKYGKGAITTSMFCAGLKEGGKDACQGDSGGPIIDVSSGNVVGVVSWGEGCAEPNYPGVYARVGALLPFIQSHLS